MKVGVVISMYDEYQTVLSSINEIKNKFPKSSFFIVQSDDGKGDCEERRAIRQEAHTYTLLSDLSKEYSRAEFPARCICRNFSAGFSALYRSGYYDLIVAFVGDTLITDAESLARRFNDMKNYRFDAMITQPYLSTMRDERCGSRIVTRDDVDLTCCFFLVDGRFADLSQVFSDIPVFDKYCSETCLGRELYNKIKRTWGESVCKLNYESNTYGYDDGIIYHSLHGGPAARWKES